MTSVSYSDCEAYSANRQWKATAVSPHNGTIPRQDGTEAVDAFETIYKDHQCEFRYRLENASGQTIWERWQGPDEDSPGQLVVADDGALVVRTHGFHPQLLAFRPDGTEAIRIQLLYGQSPTRQDPSSSVEENSVLVNCMSQTTAGCYWAEHSWPYFVKCSGRALFVWRARNDQRIVVDLDQGRLIREESFEYASIIAELDSAEATGTLSLLNELAAHKEAIAKRLSNKDASLSSEIWHKLAYLSAAALLAGKHQLRESIPALVQLQELDWIAYWTSSTGMRRYSTEVQYLRPIVQHSLRVMNIVPGPFPSYHFIDSKGNRFPVSPPAGARASQLSRLEPGWSARSVLELVGHPDFVSKTSRKRWKIYVWPETWDYDEYDGQTWRTTRLVWEEGVLTNPLASVSVIEAPWLRSNDRLTEILR